jgi:hypothetical protein
MEFQRRVIVAALAAEAGAGLQDLVALGLQNKVLAAEQEQLAQTSAQVAVAVHHKLAQMVQVTMVVKVETDLVQPLQVQRLLEPVVVVVVQLLLVALVALAVVVQVGIVL